MPDAARIALVTGAAGVMGVRLVARLVSAGWRVRGLVLPKDPGRERLERLGATVHEGDISHSDSLAGSCDGVDTVFHLAAIIISHDVSAFRRINRDGTANVVAEARRAGVRHVVCVSSASVTYPKRTPYAESKLEAEVIVANGGPAYTIVRPTLVYDAGGGQELLMYLAYLTRFPVVPFIGSGVAKKRPVWAEDVVDGIVRIAGNEAALGKTYNLSGAEAISMLDFSRLLLAQQGIEKTFVPLPVFACRLAASVLARFMEKPPLTASAIAGIVNDADLDPALAMRELGYRPLGVREGLPRHFKIEARPAGGADAVRTAPHLEGALRWNQSIPRGVRLARRRISWRRCPSCCPLAQASVAPRRAARKTRQKTPSGQKWRPSARRCQGSSSGRARAPAITTSSR